MGMLRVTGCTVGCDPPFYIFTFLQGITTSQRTTATNLHRPCARPTRSLHATAQGVKLGDLQATVMGMLSAALFFVISHAKPLDALSPQRPHPNIFSAYVFLSLLGQFAAHMGFLVYMYYGALAAMPKVRLSSMPRVHV